MRVISGSAGGRKLKEPAGDTIKPSGDRVKESVFNIIQFDIEGRYVLDLFAGTGQFGIEAISRGAKKAVFVDSDAGAIRLIRENLNICGFTGRANVVTGEALRYLENDDKYDLIFIDPPYDAGLADKALIKITEFDKLNKNGIIMCETRADSVLPVVTPPYFMQKEYKYGTVKITRYTRESR